MKIGIIIHSHTGNTLSVANRLKDKLVEKGYEVNIDRVTAVNEDPSAVDIQLKDVPKIHTYDMLIFGAPVRAFGLSPVMKIYLDQLSSLQGKKIGCFVTQQFPYEWMGGKNAIGKMKNICKLKDSDICKTGIVNWSNKQRESKIDNIIKTLSDI